MKVSGEDLSVYSKTASGWVKSVWVECQQGYSEEDIYNEDETGVFYNMTPGSTFKFKGEKCVNEDDLPLSEWLKENGITKCNHLSDIDNFIHADDDLMTSGNPTGSDIIETILNEEDSDEDNFKFVEDTVSTKSVPTYSKAQDAVEKVIAFFENSATSGGVFDTLSVIKGNLRDLQVKSFKQCTILNF
jgi:hypothetical protein